MGEELARLSLDMVGDVLRDWLRANERAAEVFAGLPAETQQWARDHGPGWEALVPVTALLNPELRELGHATLSDAVTTIERLVNQDLSSLSHPAATIDGERPSDGAGMDEAETRRRLEALERRFEDLEALVRRAVELAVEVDTKQRIAAGALIGGPLPSELPGTRTADSASLPG